MSFRAAYPLLLAAACLLLLLQSASVPLTDPDEARFARTSVEMLRSGDLVVPQFEGKPRLVKPPLLHWIQAWLFSLVGPAEWAARLHAALATLGSILLVGWICARRFGPEGRLWGVAIFATMPLVLVPGRVGTLDALLAVHVLAVIALDLVDDEERSAYRAAGVGALMGLAFLVKGPVGIVLPLLVMLAGRTMARRSLLPSWRAVLQAAAAWAVVVLPWGLAFIQRVGSGTTGGTLRREVLERYFAGTAHGQPPWFYLLVVAAGFLPWSAPLVVGLVRAFRFRSDPLAPTAVYAGSGLIAGIVFFSLSPGKVASYLLPLAPLAALVVTWELGRELEQPRQRTLGPTLLAATLAAAATLLAVAGLPRLEEAAERTTAVVGIAAFGLAALVAISAAMMRRPRWAYGAAACASATFLFTAVLVLFPSIGAGHSSKGLVERLPLLAGPRPVVTVEVRVPSLTYYLDKIPEVAEMQQLEARLDGEDRPLLILVDVDLPDVPPAAAARLREVGRHGKYRVFEEMPAN